MHAVFEHELNEYKSVQVTRILHDFYDADPKRGFYGGGGIDGRINPQPAIWAMSAGGELPRWGADLKARIEAFPRSMVSTGHTTSLPVETNSVSIDPTLKDAWGIPAMRVTYKDHPDDLAFARFLQDRSGRDHAGRRRAEGLARRGGRIGVGRPSAGHLPHGQRSRRVGDRQISPHARRAEFVPVRRVELRYFGARPADHDHSGVGVSRGRSHRPIRQAQRNLRPARPKATITPRMPVQSKLQEAIELHQRGQLAHARRLYHEILAVQPQHPKALHLLGVIAAQTGDQLQALELIDKALAIDSGDPVAHFNRGAALQGLRQFDAAAASYDRAIELKPDYADAYCIRGTALIELKRFDEALLSCDRAIELDPDFAEAYANRGIAFEQLCRWEEAAASYERAVAIRPDFGFLWGNAAHARMQLCDWTDAKAAAARLTARIQRGEPACSPFPLLALSGSAPLQRRAAEIWVRHKCPPDATLGAISMPERHARIRIGYFSADFREHAVSRLTAELFETMTARVSK